MSLKGKMKLKFLKTFSCISAFGIIVISLFSCASNSNQEGGLDGGYIYTVANKIVATTNNCEYELCDSIEKIKDVGEIIIDENHRIGYLVGFEDLEEAETSEKDTIFVPSDKTEEVLINGEKAAMPIYSIDGWENDEYIALCPSWYISIYSKII